jgi:hypothetical protein
MADNIRYFINNQEYNPPKEWVETTLEINYDASNVGQKVGFSDVTFVRENSTLIQDFIRQYGVFVAIPFKKTVNNSVVFDGFITLSDDPQTSPMQSRIKLIENQSIDWLNEVADGFTFEYLAKAKGTITFADYKILPYVIERPTDWTGIAIMQLTVFTVVNEIQAAIQKIQELTAESANPLEVSAIIKLALYIIYLIVLFASLIKLIVDIFRLLIQPVKYHAAMTFRKHFEKGCQELGLNFSSPIEDLDWVYLPEKYQLPPDGKGLFGFFNSGASAGFEGYYKGTFGDFIRLMVNIFKGKINIVEGTMYFFKQNFNFGQPQLTLPNLEYRDDLIGYNSNELKSNYYLTFQTDLSDNNTIIEYQGTAIQIITANAYLPNGWQTTLKGLEEVNLEVALGKRKTQLSTVEKIADAFYKIIGGVINTLIKITNAVIKGINAIIKTINRIIKALKTIGINLKFQLNTIKPLQLSNFGNTIENRIGMLKLENDYFNTPKIIAIDNNNKLKTVQPSARYLWQTYHKEVVSFVGNDPAQYRIYPSKKIRFKEADYLLVKNNKFVNTFEGKEAELISLVWNDWEQSADVSFKIREKYDNNLIEYELEPTGT